jgi:hypothetical protein
MKNDIDEPWILPELNPGGGRGGSASGPPPIMPPAPAMSSGSGEASGIMGSVADLRSRLEGAPGGAGIGAERSAPPLAPPAYAPPVFEPPYGDVIDTSVGRGAEGKGGGDGGDETPRAKKAKSRRAEPEEASSEAVLQHRVAQRQARQTSEESKKGKKKKKKRSDKNDSSDSDSSSSGQVFRGALSENKIRKLATRHPGRLFEHGITSMGKYLRPLDGGEGASDQERMIPTATRYLTTVLSQSRSGSAALGVRSQRELRTLAEASDALASGELGKCGDLLMQRFKAVEEATDAGGWEVARHLELIPEQKVSIVSDQEREMASSKEVKRSKLESSVQKGRK